MKTNNIWVADFETIISDTEYFKQHKRTGIVYGYMENLDNPNWNIQFVDMWDFLNFFTTRRCNHYVFFHNLSFDGVFILDFLGKNGFSCVEQVEKQGQFSVFRTTGSKIYKIELGFIPLGCKKIRKIHFQCSKLILSSSVKALGKNANIDKFEKGEEDNPDFYKREPESDLRTFYYKNKSFCEYCKRDVKIVIRALKDFYKAIYDFLEVEGLKEHMNKVFECMTISAVSILLQRLMIEKQNLPVDGILLHRVSDRMIMDKFTNGGLTINNLDYIQKDLSNIEGHIIDLKSAYPAVMSDRLPFGDMLFTKPDGVEGIDYCVFQQIYYDAIWADNHNIPLLKNWENSKPNYFCVANEYTTYLLKEEAQAIETLYKYAGKKIIKEYYFILKPYLTDFINKMFEYKEHYKKIGDLGKSHTFKILLNSGYGIHAKRIDFKLVLPFNGEDYREIKDIPHKVCDNIDLNETNRHSYIPNNNLEAFKPLITEDLHIPTPHKGIANYITAKTRIKLINGINHFKPENFVYCDTDSLFLINLKKEYIQQYCGDKLGDWEIEQKVYDNAYFARPKLYYVFKDGMLVKMGSAGVDGEKVDLEELKKELSTEVKDACLIPLRVDGGLILEPVNKLIKLEKIIPNLDINIPKDFDEVFKKYGANQNGKK